MPPAFLLHRGSRAGRMAARVQMGWRIAPNAALAYTRGMTRDDIQRTALALPAEERRELVEVLWESLESDPEPLPERQRRLVDERLEALEANPEEGSTWDEVEKRIWAEEE